jgi:hypothetical protein
MANSPESNVFGTHNLVIFKESKQDLVVCDIVILYGNLKIIIMSIYEKRE